MFFRFDTENGISAQEQGSLKQLGNEVVSSVAGSFSYQAPDGTPVQAQYIADENGFRAEGTAIHQIPKAIVRALEWNAAHPEEEQEQKTIRINY